MTAPIKISAQKLYEVWNLPFCSWMDSKANPDNGQKHYCAGGKLILLGFTDANSGNSVLESAFKNKYGASIAQVNNIDGIGGQTHLAAGNAKKCRQLSLDEISDYAKNRHYFALKQALLLAQELGLVEIEQDPKIPVLVEPREVAHYG